MLPLPNVTGRPPATPLPDVLHALARFHCRTCRARPPATPLPDSIAGRAGPGRPRRLCPTPLPDVPGTATHAALAGHAGRKPPRPPLPDVTAGRRTCPTNVSLGRARGRAIGVVGVCEGVCGPGVMSREKQEAIRRFDVGRYPTWLQRDWDAFLEYMLTVALPAEGGMVGMLRDAQSEIYNGNAYAVQIRATALLDWAQTHHPDAHRVATGTTTHQTYTRDISTHKNRTRSSPLCPGTSGALKR